MRVTRRSVLGFGLAVALPGAALAAGSPAAFVGQSGEPNSGRCVLGALITDDEAGLRAMVSALREKTSYRRVLRSRSTDKYKVAFAKMLVDELARRTDTRFEAVDLSMPYWPVSGEAPTRLVRAATAELLAAVPAGAPVFMVDNGDATNFGALHRATSPASKHQVFYNGIADDDLLQCAALLTGLANPQRAHNRSAKGELLAHLELRLTTEDISTRSPARHPVFRMRQVTLVE